MDLQAGVNLTHLLTLFHNTFLSSLNQNSEAVMRLFATAPDFKESFTRYQVEHISGKTSGTTVHLNATHLFLAEFALALMHYAGKSNTL